MDRRQPLAMALLYPAVIVASCLLAAALIPSIGIVAASALIVGTAAVLLTALERWQSYCRAWRPTLRSMRIDVLHSLVSALVAAPVVRATSVAMAVWLGAKLSAWLGTSVWPESWPLVFQVALAIAIADLGAYTAHRFMHATSIGWRLHAVHHTPTRLYALAAGRAHPLNALLTMSCESIPVIALGITPEAFALLAIFKAVNGLLQHSNVAMRPGLLSYVIATCDVHRFHHSIDLAESNTNFGNTTMIWDHVFGTFHLPHRHPDSAVGIADIEMPEVYAVHLLAPFRLGRYVKPGPSP